MDKTVLNRLKIARRSGVPSRKEKNHAGSSGLISTRSYHGTSTLHMARRAGLSQAALFKYFKTKDDLLTAIFTSGPRHFRCFEELCFETTEERGSISSMIV